MRNDYIRKREQKIDDALKASFPASDTPAYVGAGAPRGAQGIDTDERDQGQPADKKRAIEPDDLTKKK